jgi:amino acid transporter
MAETSSDPSFRWSMAADDSLQPMRVHPETGRPESEQERVDRNLQELLGELRVALPGVQVLFAFLLVVPFNQRFVKVTDFQEKVYFVTLLCAAAASAFLIAPSVHHRIEFRRQDKEHIVLVANRLAVIGLTFLAVAMTGAILLVTDVLFGALTSALATIAVGTMFAALWYAIPLRRLLSRS